MKLLIEGEKMETIVLKEKHMRGDKPNVTLVSGSWIAGGSVRRWFTGEKQDSDIDVFCLSTDIADEFIETNDLVERIRNEKMVMFKNSPVQLILSPSFASGEDTISHFDYTLCQFMYDGTTIKTTVDAVTAVLRKYLGVHKIQDGFEIDSLRRAFKYTKQGYHPCIGTIRDIAKALNNAPAENLTKFDTISPERWD